MDCSTPGAHQASLSMGFPRQKYWSGLPFPSPGDLPDPGLEPMPFTIPALASATWEAVKVKEQHGNYLDLLFRKLIPARAFPKSSFHVHNGD